MLKASQVSQRFVFNALDSGNESTYSASLSVQVSKEAYPDCEHLDSNCLNLHTNTYNHLCRYSLGSVSKPSIIIDKYYRAS